MRITRTLLTSAVVAASVALSAPVASAVDVVALSSSQAKASQVGDARGDDSDNGNDKDGKDYGNKDDKDYGDKDDKDYGDKGDKGYGDKGDHDRKGGHHWKGHKPHGGVHAGGGALAMTVADGGSSKNNGDDNGDDNGYDNDDDNGYGNSKGKESDDYGDKDDKDYGDKDDKDYGDKGYGDKGDHDRKGGHHWKGHKPHGGVHAGGGGLAQSPDTLALGSVLVLGGLGAGAYMLRRRQTSDSVA
ncbi:hypothetical protein [Streptomyces thermoalcalitolerans]|uniref:Gram-positive cocci surface proteins LPxTG domain-containing protein n=1 Tax=Streptomyces thermoalcalitolerans TaxID=65605 RepID=A0ABN1PIU6_9ACTN